MVGVKLNVAATKLLVTRKLSVTQDALVITTPTRLNVAMNNSPRCVIELLPQHATTKHQFSTLKCSLNGVTTSTQSTTKSKYQTWLPKTSLSIVGKTLRNGVGNLYQNTVGEMVMYQTQTQPHHKLEMSKSSVSGQLFQEC